MTEDVAGCSSGVSEAMVGVDPGDEHSVPGEMTATEVMMQVRAARKHERPERAASVLQDHESRIRRLETAVDDLLTGGTRVRK